MHSAFGGIPQPREQPGGQGSIFDPGFTPAQEQGTNIFAANFGAHPMRLDPSDAQPYDPEPEPQRAIGRGHTKWGGNKSFAPLKARVAVPDPIMPYNDISNDHYLNKYPF